jgi:SAM-dependent methyltransferase
LIPRNNATQVFIGRFKYNGGSLSVNSHGRPRGTVIDLHFSDLELAELYDTLSDRERSPRDFDFYLPLVMAADSVLDVGCGTGALLHEARSMGHHGYLCGLDPAPGMIAVARRHRDIEWVQGDLTAANLTRRFDLIVMTGHAFQVFLEDEEIHRTLTAIRALLTPQGRLAFETRNPGARDWQSWPQNYAAEGVDRLGRTVRVTLRIEAPFDGRLLSFSQTYASPAWDPPRVSRSTLRFVEPSALGEFLAGAGLAVERQFGDWDRTPLTETSPEIITLARAR